MAITDPHTEELLILLKKERQAEAPTIQQIITYRRNAEDIVSHDDNLFRINWVCCNASNQVSWLLMSRSRTKVS
jgi:histone deacetylase complex regulatory component SIN3